MSRIAFEYLKLDSKGRTWVHLVCRKQIRWPDVARRWRRRHPELFDDDDVVLAESQGTYHLPEWIAAIHFWETRGVSAVLEKWKDKAVSRRGGFHCHPEKAKRVRRILGEERYALLCQGLQGAGPDLFLYDPRDGRCWFAEVKKTGDRLNGNQKTAFGRIERRFRVPVQLVRVHVVAKRRARAS